MNDKFKAELEELRKQKDNELDTVKNQAEKDLANLQQSLSNTRSM